MKVVKREGVVSFAHAIYQLGVEAGKPDLYLEQLAQLNQAVLTDQAALLSFVNNPTFSGEEVRQVLSEIGKKLGLETAMTAFLVELANARKLAQLPAVLEIYQELHYKASKRQLVTVRSAMALTPTQRQMIEGGLPAMMQKAGVQSSQFEINAIIDPSLLGGVVVEIGSKVFDGSVRGRINRLKEEILTA